MKTKKSKRFDKKIDVFSDEFWEEQKRLEAYIQMRAYPRPKTKITSVLVWIVIYLFVSFFIAMAGIYTFQITNYKWLIYLISYVFFACLFSNQSHPITVL